MYLSLLCADRYTSAHRKSTFTVSSILQPKRSEAQRVPALQWAHAFSEHALGPVAHMRPPRLSGFCSALDATRLLFNLEEGSQNWSLAGRPVFLVAMLGEGT